MEEVLVTVGDGTLRGRREGGLTVLLGVRYATADRFAPPKPEVAWSGVRDALAPRGICPQPPNRKDSSLGPVEDLPATEDCLELTIRTPGADGARRPVIVFMHGGSYRTGASSWSRYSGARLALEGDAVVVGVTSRLGPLGFLRLPGVSDGNQGLLDLVEALRWVRANATFIGGDPDNVTVVGQSSGAHAIAALLGSTALDDDPPLLRRAVLQSAPLGLGIGDGTRAVRAGRHFRSALGGDPHDASIPQIVAAQLAAERALAGPAGLNQAPTFAPAAGVDPLPDAAGWRERCRRRAPGLEVIIGTARDEMAHFLAGGPISRRIPLAGPALERLAIRLGTAFVFTRPNARFAGLLARAGATVFRYRLDPGPFPYLHGASHCVDLPLLFGAEAAWAHAPILAGRAWERVDADGHEIRGAWLAFAWYGAAGLVGDGWTADGSVRSFPVGG
ncbi:carboxylesterase family protein [Dactylosporangium sp. CA-233914]|uniref:carboxylesterase family protein n=1 Tax=Dactylosporangium sp. CA-233914 TaxID=3239934 RepID=UPI003D89D42B